MKRLNNLYQQICSLDNLRLADARAQKGKSQQYGVQIHNRNAEGHLLVLRDKLLNRTYKTSTYQIFTIYEPKEREVFRLPYYPDRIVHHAIMNILEPVFMSVFTADSYSCVKGKGIHGAFRNLKKALRNEQETQYCLKLDIKKFYPSVDHDILKALLRRKIKDADLLWLLDEIIDSAPGLPIGNYLSQYFANFYLTPFDHWIKEEMGVKYYFRYSDDIVIPSHSKPYLHALRVQITEYLLREVKLQVKGNYRVFPVACGIDFLGYVFRHTHVRMRKSIKQSFARKVAKGHTKSIASYYGWATHCDSKNLLNKLLK